MQVTEHASRGGGRLAGGWALSHDQPMHPVAARPYLARGIYGIAG